MDAGPSGPLIMYLMNRSVSFLSISVAALILFAAPAPAQIGVEVHRLEIKDGNVYHDGEQIPESALPDGFDARGVSFTFEYAGPVVPAITIDGRVYALEGNRLVAIADADPDDSTRAIGVMPVESSAPEPDGRRRQAEEAYLETLSERDRTLYERLMNERHMEDDVIRLAHALRQTSDPEAKAELRTELRRHLEQMFALKQENRLEEIRQVEEMLNLMREQLAARQEHRDELVDEHLRQLAGDQ